MADIEERLQSEINKVRNESKEARVDLRSDLNRELPPMAKEAAALEVAAAFERDTNSLKRVRLMVFVASGVGVVGGIGGLLKYFLGG